MIKWIDANEENLEAMWDAHKEIMEALIAKKVGPFATMFIVAYLLNRYELRSFDKRSTLQRLFYTMIEAVWESERMKAAREILRTSKPMTKWRKDNGRFRPPDAVRIDPDFAAEIMDAAKMSTLRMLKIMNKHKLSKAAALLLLATLTVQYQLAFKLTLPVVKADVAKVWDFCAELAREKIAKN